MTRSRSSVMITKSLLEINILTQVIVKVIFDEVCDYVTSSSDDALLSVSES